MTTCMRCEFDYTSTTGEENDGFMAFDGGWLCQKCYSELPLVNTKTCWVVRTENVAGDCYYDNFEDAMDFVIDQLEMGFTTTCFDEQVAAEELERRMVEMWGER